MTDKENKVDRQRVKTLQILAEMRQKAGGDPDLDKYYNTLMQTVWSGGKDTSCAEFVADFCRIHKIEVKPNGIFRDGDLVRNHKAFFYRMHETWRDYARTHDLKIGDISRDTIALEFEAILEQEWDGKRQVLRKNLKPKEDLAKFDQMVHDFTLALCGKVYDPESLDFRRSKAFVAHFLWQLQMKLHRGPESILRQGNESMLLLVSRQQKTGKSTTVRRLIEAITDLGFVWKTDFNRLEDQFSLQNLAYNYIAWFDDAGRASVKNMAKFKQIVTDDEVNFRAMYTQTEMRMPKLATLIGTSNKPARELIHDTTGLRRIHQIFVNGDSVDTGGGIDLDFLSNFDHVELLRCTPISEQESPLFRYITPQELSAYEDETRPRSLVELWVEDLKYSPGTSDNPNAKLMKSSDLYKSLVMWASENGYTKQYTPTAEGFKHKLIELGFEAGRTKSYRGFYVEVPDVVS